jgi:hypothetical protein
VFTPATTNSRDNPEKLGNGAKNMEWIGIGRRWIEMELNEMDGHRLIRKNA